MYKRQVYCLYAVVSGIYMCFLSEHGDVKAFYKMCIRDRWIGVFIALIGMYFLCMNGAFSLSGSDLLLLAEMCIRDSNLPFLIFKLRLNMIQFNYSAL